MITALARRLWPAPDWADHLHEHLHRLGRQLMAAQDDINAIAADLGTIEDELTAGINELEAQITAGQTPDLSALQSVRDRIKATADALPQAPSAP